MYSWTVVMSACHSHMSSVVYSLEQKGSDDHSASEYKIHRVIHLNLNCQI